MDGRMRRKSAFDPDRNSDLRRRRPDTNIHRLNRVRGNHKHRAKPKIIIILTKRAGGESGADFFR